MKKLIYLLMSLSFVAFVSCSDDKENEQSGSGNVPENSSSVLSSSGKERGHSYVDLGLPSGTLWATCNVGAATPQDYGNHYAWGEVTTKETYDWSTYKYGSTSKQLTKYCDNSEYGKDGFTDNKTTLELSDDAAYVNWGGKWRMPTQAQLFELCDECYCVWTENYNNSNVKGCIVYKAKKSSDKGESVNKSETPSPSYSLADTHIFLPVAGVYGFPQSLEVYTNVNGGVWSSTLSLSNDIQGPFSAKSMAFNHVVMPPVVAGPYFGTDRYYGLSVRAVIPGNK